jgi:hypothetical protein
MRFEIIEQPKSRFEIVEDAPSVVDGQSGLTNFTQAMGAGVADLGLGAKQRFDEGAAYLENKLAGSTLGKVGNAVGQALGMPTAADTLKSTQAAVVDKRAMDAPLMATTGGKIGNFTGKALPAVAASFIPGGQTLAGSVLTGGAMGMAEPTAGDESWLKNTGIGMLGGGVGYGAAKGIGQLGSWLGKRSAAALKSNSLVDANTKLAREAGYSIPVSQSNPANPIANILDITAGGRPKMAQAASLKNQPVTNKLAAKALGLPDEPITVQALENVRKAANNSGYAPIANAGTIVPSQSYTQALDDIVKATKGASNSFPGAVKNDIPTLIDGLRVKQFDSGEGLQMIQVLRDQADTAYRSGNNALGKANKQAAKALEDAIEDHLSVSGATDALKGFRDARKLMAKTFTVQKALNSETGDVAASRLAQDLAKGKPLEGELLQIAKMGKLSPTNVKSMQYATPVGSQLENAAATTSSIMTGNAAPMLIPPARSVLRDMMLTGPVQKAFGKPSYPLSQMTPQQLEELTKQLVRFGAPASAAGGLLNFPQK